MEIIFRKKCFLLLILCICSFIRTNGQSNSAWFRGNFGILVHYLNDLQNTKQPWNQGKVTSWNQCVNEFDTEKFAQQISDIKAKYLIFTIQQGDRYFCIPNLTFEKMTAYKRGTATVNRDLVADLYNSLNKRGIKLMLYVTGDGVSRDYGAASVLNNPLINITLNRGNYHVTNAWVTTWSKVLRDVSLRYGNKVAGWWVDGTYPFIGYNDNFLKILKDALKAGNPNSIVAFNQAPQNEVKFYSKWDDYTAGEMNNINSYPPPNGLIGGVQWHLLTYYGDDWGHTGWRFSVKNLSEYINECNRNFGSVTLDIQVKRDGSLDLKQYTFLRQLSI